MDVHFSFCPQVQFSVFFVNSLTVAVACVTYKLFKADKVRDWKSAISLAYICANNGVAFPTRSPEFTEVVAVARR
jgi:hypothetical protein